MYSPKIFENTDLAEQLELIRTHPLATLIVNTEQGLEANHIPFVLDNDTQNGSIRLLGHIAKQNPLHLNTLNGDDALLVFNGPEAYISPSYYPSKQNDPRVVPTWNYTSVHVRGSISFIRNPAWLYSMLERLTASQEQAFARPWRLEDAPADYLQKMQNAIVGIEINVESIQGKWKVSQNQSAENQQGVIDGLTSSGEEDMASIINAKR